MKYRADAEVQADGRAADQEGLEAGTAGLGDGRAVGLEDGQAADRAAGTEGRAGTEVCAFSGGEVSADVFCKTVYSERCGRKN